VLDAQLSEIQTWIAEGVGAIVALPLDNNAIIPLIKSAHAKGTKFLDYSDNALPGVDGWVIFDNLQGAKLVGDYAGQWVNQNLGGKAEVALLTHQIQLTGRQRVQGCLAALQSVAPGAKVVAQHEGVLSPDTFPAFQSMLQAHPGINVAICIADEGCAGVEQAFMGTHPSAARIKDMFICGFDGSAPVIKDVGTGGPIRATGALDAVAIGKASIETAANAIEGKSPTKINFPYVLCDVNTAALNQKLLAELQ
jgi:ribose transport system substrate-binding protein